MKKVWRVSDNSTGMMYDIEDEKEYWAPKRLAEYIGCGESGEIIQIWDDANVNRDADHAYYWDSRRREYRPCGW